MSYFRLTLRLVTNQSASPLKLIDKNIINQNQRRFLMVTSSLSKKQEKQEKNLENYFQYQQIRALSTQPSKHNDMTNSSVPRHIFTQQITKNLTLCTDRPRNVEKDLTTLRLNEPVDKPLVLMFSWLLAKKKHLLKYSKLYVDQGYDVLTVEITPWQLLWPVKGTQLVAQDVVKFIESNDFYNPIVLHGFSVGGYVWGECMVQMSRDINRFGPICDRVVAQIWDSAADITEIPIGVPKSIFPRNPTLQKALRNYTFYHLKTFHEQATSHYIRSSQIFHSTLVKSPALFFLSKNDPIGAETSNLVLKDSYESAGIKCTWKCWEKSAHVLHYYHHTDEYLQFLRKHLETNVTDKIAEKQNRAKL